MQSDAYYVHRLLEQIQSLQERLGKTIGEDATLTQRCSALSQKMQKLIATADDSMVQSVFEVTLLPSLDVLLLDASYQLKLRKFAQKIKPPTPRDAQPPPVPVYLPNPKPEYNEDNKEKIEQALSLLKNFLAR